MAVFVESDQGCHRDGSCLQSDKEHQEVSGGNHEIHTKQGREYKYIELTLLE